MNLNDFERHIPKVIVARGEDYFFDQRVESLTETEPGHFQAIVAGSDDYTLSIKLDDKDSIIEALCDCPYTDGSHCKHMVAVFFALREKKTGAKPPRLSQAEQPSMSSSPNTPAEDSLRRYLSSLSKEELLDLILTFAEDFPEIGDHLKAHASPPDEEAQYWLNIMRHSIEQAMDYDGFVNFRHCRQAVDGALEAVARAETALDDNEYELAADLLAGILEEMASLVQFADDSGGEVGMVTNEVEQLLLYLADCSPGDAARESCFNKLLKSAQKTCFDGWSDWRIALLSAATALVATEQQRTRLEDYFQQILAKHAVDDSSFSSAYEAETVSFLHYSLITRLDGPDQATDFLYRHLSFPRFRKMAITQLLGSQKYKEAESLALEGEEKDARLPGLVKQWKELRFGIYQQGNDIDRLRRIAAELVLEGSFEYYEKLKNTYSPAEWAGVYPAILDDIEHQTHFSDRTYTAILIEECEWDKLLSHVMNQPSKILDYYRHLTPHYPGQVYELFAKVILNQSEHANNRSQYQQIKSHLRLLKKIGGTQQAQDLTRELLAKYPRRPAFRDELLKV